MGDPAAGYVHLDVISGFSFRRGASHPEALVERAVALGYDALALTDWHGVYGVPRFVRAARAAGIRPIVGATVEVTPGGRLVLLVEDAAGWANLCRLLSAANLAGSKERPRLTLPTLALHAAGLAALAGPDTLVAARLLAGDGPGAAAALAELRDVFGGPGGRLRLELADRHTPADWRRNRLLAELGQAGAVGLVATNMVEFATPEDGPVHDVLTCLRVKTSLPAAGPALAPNREGRLKSRAEMATLFAWRPGALAAAGRLAEACAFAPDALDGRLPPFPLPPGETAFSHLHRLATDGARARYRPLSPAAARQLAHELEVIERLGFADYFLIVADLCREARARGILCQGRGSAANSVVAYALHITNVDPVGLGLLFERFLSDDRAEMPDIDVDFANDRRDEIIQYAYDRYGRDRCAMVAEYICYRDRRGPRDVGRALGLPPTRLAAFARDLAAAMGAVGAGDEPEGVADPDGVEDDPDSALLAPTPLRLVAAGAAAADPAMPPPAATLTDRLAEAAARMADLPRHLGIHSGGLVLTDRLLVEMTPIERARKDGRTVIGWDKDDVAAMGLVKIDLLALGMLTLLGRCLRLIKQARGVDLDLGRLQPDDAAVFDLLQRADTVGVFQVESRAQMNLAPRLKPRTFYDLVISVALIRPGPIQGDSVHPYLRRRAGVEPVSYPHPLAAPILERTLGVPLFQEQGMRLAMAIGGFTAGEADALRRAMGSKRSSAAMRVLEAGFFAGAAERGVERAAAEEVWAKLAAFASYGFAESHAASFALLAYQSAYLKHYYPEAYACAYLNSLPMGFWPVDTIVGDARRRGIPILPPDAQAGAYDWTLEEQPGGAWALRTGLRAVKGVGEEHAARLDAARRAGAYRDLDDIRRRTGLAGDALTNLGACGAFAGLDLDRRAALWAALAARPPAGALSGLASLGDAPALPPMTPAEELVEDYRVLGFSPRGHLMTLRRAAAARVGARRLAELATLPAGVTARVAGMVSVAQAPPSAHGMAFVTLEDETGLGDLTLRPPEAARHRATLAESALVLAEGRVQRAEGVASLLVRTVTPLADAR